MTAVDCATIFDVNTRQLTAGYKRAVREALPANLSPTDEFWRALAAVVEGYFTMVERRGRRPPKRELERWKRIGDLVDELGEELRAVRRQTRWDVPGSVLSNRALEALAPIKLAAEVHIAGYAWIVGASSSGRGVAQLFLYGAILDLWRDLGQEVRYSRKASGLRFGPLVRFFTACVGPILGDEMPTARGIADVIDRERTIASSKRLADVIDRQRKRRK